MSECREWPGLHACAWENKPDAPRQFVASRTLRAHGIGIVAELLVRGSGFIVCQHQKGRGLSFRLPGNGTRKAAVEAITAIYGAEPGPLPTEEEFAERWQAWMEGRR